MAHRPTETISVEQGNEDPPMMVQLSRLQAIQEERVLTYALLEQGYQDYIKSGPSYDFNTYKKLIHEISEVFNELNVRTKVVRETLVGVLERTDLGDIIDRMNQLEKDKLELTSKYYMAGQVFMDSPDTDDSAISLLTKQIDANNKDIASLEEDLKYEMRE
eukprot:CFRG5646T1